MSRCGMNRFAVKQMIDDPPEWLEDGLRERPGFTAFARENGSVFHTYTVMAPDPFVSPYSSQIRRRPPKTDSRTSAPGARACACARYPSSSWTGPRAIPR